MADTIRRLQVVLDANSSGFQKKFAEAGKATKSLESQISALQRTTADGPLGSIADGLLKIANPAAAAALAIGSVTAAILAAGKAANDFLQKAGKLSDLNAKTALGTEFLQRLGAAGAESSTSMDTAADAAFKLQKTIGEAAQGSKEARQAFADIGVSLDQLKGKSPEEQFILVGRALQAIPDQERFVAAGTSVMGKGFSEVAALIRSDFVGAMTNASVVSGDLIEKGDAIGDAFSRLGAAGETLKLQFGAALIQAATGGADAAAAIDTMTRAVAGLSTIVAAPGFQTGIRAILALGSFGLSESLISSMKTLAEQGGNTVDAAAARARAIADTQQQIRTELAQAAAAKREADKARADATRKASEEARKALEEERRALADLSKDMGAFFDELGKRREARETFSLLGDSIDDINVRMGRLADQLERFAKAGG